MRAAALGLLLAACGSDRTADILELEGDAVAGATVYATRCLSCHGEGGAGGTGPAIAAPGDDADFVDTVLYGSGTMSGLEDVLSDQDVADLLSFAAEGFQAATTSSAGCRASTGCG